jgi:3-hydroxyacyl-CoA dehydrogenase
VEYVIKRNPETTVDKSMIQVSNSYSIAIGSDLIIDASAESYEVKESVYCSINENVSGNTVIATTTSSLNIEKLSTVARPLC